MFSLKQLGTIMPNAATRGRAETFHPLLRSFMSRYEINTHARICCFLATVAVETAEFRFLQELWGPTQAQLRYEPPSRKARQLGNTEQGDGYRFRGRGLIQITGRYNYRVLSEAFEVGFVSAPDQLCEPKWATRSACWWWWQNDCNKIADTMGIEGVSKRVNLGNENHPSTPNHMDRRQNYFDLASQVIPDFSDVISGVAPP